MFPSDRSAILNTLARKVAGQTTNLDAISLNNLLDYETLQAYADSAWKRFWSKYTQYGIVSAGILMTLAILKLSGRIISMVFNYLNLYAVFGCSCWLLSAIYSGLTIFLLHRKNFEQNAQDLEDQHEDPQAEELMPERS